MATLSAEEKKLALAYINPTRDSVALNLVNQMPEVKFLDDREGNPARHWSREKRVFFHSKVVRFGERYSWKEA